MEKTLKTLKIVFIASFLGLLILSGIILYLKKIVQVQDFISASSKLIMVAPIFMLGSILVAYFLYDRLAKKSKKIEGTDSSQRFSLFQKAMFIKIAMFEFVGIFSALMMFLFFRNTYLYMEGIVLVFFLISFPTEYRYKKDFEKENGLFN